MLGSEEATGEENWVETAGEEEERRCIHIWTAARGGTVMQCDPGSGYF